MKKFVIVLSVLALYALLFEISHLHFTKVMGESMFPTLESGDRMVYTSNPFWKVEKDDVVLVTIMYEGKIVHVVKRVGAVGPDEVELSRTNEDGVVEFKKIQIQEGFIFLIGDNQPISLDSRMFGPVPLDWIRGYPVLKWHGTDWFPL